VLGAVCVREGLLVFLSFLVQTPGTSLRWKMGLFLHFCLQLRCCIPCCVSRACHACGVIAPANVFNSEHCTLRAEPPLAFLQSS